MDNEIIIIIIFLMIFTSLILSNKSQIKSVEKYKEKTSVKLQSDSEHDNRTAKEIDEERNNLILIIKESITGHPKQLSQLLKIVNDWADLKIESFKERRSWVRSHEDD